MRVAVVSVGSFDVQYSDHHILRDIVVCLLERNHEVHLIQKQYFGEPRYPKAFEKYLGHRLHVDNIRFEQKPKADLKARYLADLGYYYKACRLLKKNRPDKIFLQSNNTAFFPVFYAKHILKRPLFYNEQDIFPENAYFAGLLAETSPVYRAAHALQSYAYKNAAALSTISDDMKTTIVKRYGIREEKIRVIYNWGHEELKARGEKENAFLKKHPKRDGEFRVVYAGNLGRMQNVELLLEAAALLRDQTDVQFYIIGNGVREEYLKAAAKEKALTNVTFSEMQPQEDAADVYAASDVNVIPLLNGVIYTALPSKTADCLLAGKPIITCVDDESQFAQLVCEAGMPNVCAGSAQKLGDFILKIKNKEWEQSTDMVLKHRFRRVHNIAETCSMLEAMRSESETVVRGEWDVTG